MAATTKGNCIFAWRRDKFISLRIYHFHYAVDYQWAVVTAPNDNGLGHSLLLRGDGNYSQDCASLVGCAVNFHDSCLAQWSINFSRN